MTIEITKDTIGIWYMKIGDDQDWMAGLTKVEDGLKLQYRFRYYKDDKVWDSKDEKRWYEGVLHHPLETVLPVIRALVRHMRELDGDIPEEDCYELMMGDTGLDIFMTRLSMMPFTHAIEVMLNDG